MIKICYHTTVVLKTSLIIIPCSLIANLLSSFAKIYLREAHYISAMTSTARSLPFWIYIALLWIGCNTPETIPVSNTQLSLFTQLSPQKTGIDFSNTLSQHPSPQRNRLLYEYFSNGAGVAVGDVNGDGLDDLFFTANMSYSRLYLNRGNLTFEDITDVAGVAGRINTWKTGVSMADVNGDGRLDIYVCYSGDLPLDRRIDELYINQGNDDQGIPIFEEQAAKFDLANPHSSNQAYFFDYDNDGDLDLFLLTHNVKNTPLSNPQEARTQLEQEDTMSGVRFYRNQGERFEDVTRETGISSSSLTYGLGAGISDINRDGWLDVYIGNDYSPPDYLYINNGDGTFTDEIHLWMGHTSNASMGVDVADINNDGELDVVVLDMLAEGPQRQKTLFIPNDRGVFETVVESGFHHQYMRNTLQLNNGDGTFSEIGQLAGISNTDWSWTPLLADFDNDGLKDLYVTNGILHDATDRDFLALQADYLASKGGQLEPADIAYLMDRLPSPDLKNYAFKNGGDLRFENVSSSWGLDQTLKSTGAAYADLDNDGDLDLIANNINAPASIFENHSADRTEHNYLQVHLHGEGANTAGIGARVTLYAGGLSQHLEQMPARGYLSSVSPTLHFGLGDHTIADSLEVIWPDGRSQSIENVQVNRRITIRQEDAAESLARQVSNMTPVFEEIQFPLDFEHQMAGDIDDFRRQPLMDHPQSYSGPVLAKADVNGDGLENVFVGGGAGQAGRLFIQQQNGRFIASTQPALDADAGSHDVDALFFDYNSDGYLDLYVASGGFGTFNPEDSALQDRMYENDGEGRFTKAEGVLPEMLTSTGTVASTDLNNDGRPDLFVGGRIIPGQYPESPRSYVLMNEGGHFEDRTSEIGPVLQNIGMVTDAKWHDLNGDGVDELIVVGSWMPISVFEYSGEVLRNATDDYFDAKYSGHWNALLVDDLNRDGRADLIAGNLGLNSQLRASEHEPVELYYADFNNDGAMDPLLTLYLQGKSYPHATLDELRGQMPALASRFSTHRAYAEASIRDLFADGRLEEASRLEANHLETSLFFGGKGGMFEKSPLPVEAQFSPVHAIISLDYDEDGYLDLVLAGNTDEAQIRFGKYDANYGVLFRGGNNASYAYIPQYQSGLRLKGAVRGALMIDRSLVFGVNRSGLVVYRIVGER